MKKFAFWGAGIWAIVHSILIWSVLTANISPVFDEGIDQAIESTVRLMAFVGISTAVQLFLQVELATHREVNLSTGEKWFDGITTIFPLVTIFATWWWMSDTTAKVPWWPTLSSWVFWMVLLGTALDIYNAWKGVKIWRGAAGHTAPAGGAGHHP